MKYCIFLLLMCCVLVSCRKNIDKDPWTTDMLIPVAHTSISVDKIVPDSLLEKDANNALSLVYRQMIYEFDPNQELLEIPDTTFSEILRLDSLQLPADQVTHTITLGEFAITMSKDPDFQTQLIGLAILSQNGNVTNIPPFESISSDDVAVDATQFFQTASIQSGFLDVEIKNGFPVAITDVIFELKSGNPLTSLIKDTILYIAPNSTETASIDLSGKVVEGNLVIKVININSPGGNNVLIDTSNALTIKLSTRDLVVSSATAVFSSQNLIDVSQQVTYNLNGPELTYFSIRSGKMRVDVNSTIQDSLRFNIQIPSATDRFGQMLQSQSVIPPAPPGGSINVSQEIDISGYSIDLKGPQKNKVNTFTQIFTARIDSTGKLITISMNDSLTVFYGLVDIVPSYVKGYVGKDTVELVKQDVPTDIFSKIKDGNFELESLNASFSIENGLGVDGMVRINNFKAWRGNSSVTLQSNLTGVPLKIGRAADNPLQINWTTYESSSANSNMLQLIQLMPDRFEYDLDVFVNPGGNTYNYQDFAYYDSPFNISIDVEMPLSLVANNLVMADTIPFDIGDNDDTADRIEDGYLMLIAYNGFPIDIDLQVILLNEYGEVVDSLFDASRIKAGLLDETCRVKENTRTRLAVPIDRDRYELLKQANRAIVISKYNNTIEPPVCKGKKLKIYSDYLLDLTMSARFNYRM